MDEATARYFVSAFQIILFGSDYKTSLLLLSSEKVYFLFHCNFSLFRLYCFLVLYHYHYMKKETQRWVSAIWIEKINPSRTDEENYIILFRPSA